jgi:hypothetical protein
MSEIGILVEFLQEGLEFSARLRVRRLNELIEDGSLGLVDRLFGIRSRRFSTVRAELVMGGQRLVAVSTRLSNCVGAILTFDEARLTEDVLSMLVGGDVFVRVPHVGIERPVDAMFNLRPRISLSDHSGDGHVPKGVGLDRLLNASAISDTNQLLTDSVRSDGPVVTPSFVAISAMRLDLMEESCIRIVGTGVRCSEVRSERRCRIDEWVVRDSRSLESCSVGVWSICCRFIKVDILDAQRQCEREPCSSVSQELHERNVSLVASARSKVLDVPRGENAVRIWTATFHARPFDISSPLSIYHPFEKRENAILVGFDGRVRQSVVVSECEDEVVEIFRLKFDKRYLRAFACDSNASKVGLQRRRLHRAITLFEPLLDDRLILRMHSLRVGESTPLSLETTLEILGVVNAHTGRIGGNYYKLTMSESTSFNSSEIAKVSTCKPTASSRAGGVPA